jgi:hypothetical protein
MAGELVRRTTAAQVVRARDRELAVVHKSADLAVARVAAVGEVAQAALVGTLGLSMMKRDAEMLVPDAAAKLDLVVTTAAAAMAAQINRAAGGW